MSDQRLVSNIYFNIIKNISVPDKLKSNNSVLRSILYSCNTGLYLSKIYSIFSNIIFSSSKVLLSIKFASNIFASNIFASNMFASNMFASNMFASNMFASNILFLSIMSVTSVNIIYFIMNNILLLFKLKRL